MLSPDYGADSRTASALAVLPGGVAFVHPEEQIFAAMLEGWRRQMVSRNLATETIEPRIKLIQRFSVFTGTYPWQWTPQDVIDFSADFMAPNKRAKSTLRQYQNTLRLFLEYATDSRYAWVKVCEEHFGVAPSQICDEWNTSEHVAEYEGRPERRPLTFDEVQTLFDYCDERYGTIRALKRKGALAEIRNSVAAKMTYAFGLRRREVTRTTLQDFMTNPKAPEYGRFGLLHVRWGKAVKGSAPRRRIVHTVPHMDWILDVVQQYVTDIRPKFNAGNHPALFPTERRGYLDGDNFTHWFQESLKNAELPEELTLHCLRHSYATHLAEFGYDPLFIQSQLGHSYQSTTSIYTHVSNDFKNLQVRQALADLYGEGPS